jgi:hypothetical protein
MVSVDDKKDKSTNLSAIVEADRQALRNLGNSLCTSDDITTINIKKVSEELTTIHNRYFPAGIDDKTQKQWNKVRGEAMTLSKLDPKKYKKFYYDALELGRKIILLAERLGVIAMPVVLGQETLSYFG